MKRVRLRAPGSLENLEFLEAVPNWVCLEL